MELLDAMMLNVKLVYLSFMLDFTHVNGAEIPIVLDKTKVELKRLLQHPELFPDRTKEWFPQVMKLELRKALDHLALQDAAHDKKYAELYEELERHKKRTLPEYDLARTAWQQFLHGQAPGSGLDRSILKPQGCSQLLTFAGMTLVLFKLAEHTRDKRLLELVGSSLRRVLHPII